MSGSPGTTREPGVPGEGIDARFFDGRSSRGHAVRVWLHGEALHIVGETARLVVPANRVQWPERTQHGPRVAQLPEGASLQSVDAAAWDAWQRAAGRREPWVVSLQQSWRAVAASAAALVALSAAGYVWGLPWAAREVAQRVPDAVEAQIGDVVLAQAGDMVSPSKLGGDEQQAIEQAWLAVLQAHTRAEAALGRTVRPTRLLIRDSDIGPNALALPGGTMLLTDDMVRLVGHDHQVLAGVLAHELGHVQHRHGMQTLVQIGVLGAATSLLWGDFSSLLATVPMWLGQAHYSRQAEREADAHSVAVLRDAGISPGVMVTLFERFELYRRCGKEVLKPAAPGARAGAESPGGCAGQAKEGMDGEAWGMGFASHPADAERIAFFRAATR